MFFTLFRVFGDLLAYAVELEQITSRPKEAAESAASATGGPSSSSSTSADDASILTQKKTEG